MNFFHITKDDGQGTSAEQSKYFETACDNQGLHYVRIIDAKFGLTELQDIAVSEKGYVYRSAVSVKAKAIEKELVSQQTKTIYYNNNTVLTGRGNSYHIMKKNGLPVIPAVSFLPHKKRETLEFANYLGGFPIVIKVMGGMEGVGVMRVDSLESFNSVSDYVKKDPKAMVNVMKYIPHEYFARLVVVGDGVVAATRDMAPLGDFRANARGPREVTGQVFTPTDEMIQDAVSAAKALGCKTAGVDLLLAADNKHYLAEVNVPYNFAETQRITGIDIASAIIVEMSK